MRAIWKRELQAYFYTPVGYVFMGVFLLLSSAMFYATIMQKRSCDLPTFIGMMSYLWMLLCPVLTMRLLAEERQKRTDQLSALLDEKMASLSFDDFADQLRAIL